jgi:hypothetical protein
MNLNTGGWASPLLRLLARLRSDGVNSTTPVTEINGGTISAPDADIALVAKGTGATLAQVPDGTLVGGNKRGTRATDWQKSRTTAAKVASGIGSTIAGGTNSEATGQFSTVGGGTSHQASNYASTVGGGENNGAGGLWATIAGGTNNNSNANYCFVGGGQSNTASTGTHGTVCGGNGNSATGGTSFTGGGQGNSSSGFISSVVGGRDNLANSEYSFVSGGQSGTTRSISGYHVFPACSVPISSTTGATQSGLLLLGRQTTDATATVLASNNGGVVATNQVTLPNNSAYSFSGEVIAGVTGAGNAARWTIDGAIKRGANAGTTAMVGTPTVTMTHNDAGASAWVVAVTANTTLGCITITVTGAAATTIRWVCRIETTEMTY